MTMMSNYLVQGPHAMPVLNRVCANDIDTAIGRVVYTQWLDERGGIIADVTVTRLADDQFMRDQLQTTSTDACRHGSAATPARASSSPCTDVTSGLALLTVQGPKSRELLQRLSPDDWSNEAFPYLTAQKVELGYTPLWALRVTYVGELGLGPADPDRVRLPGCTSSSGRPEKTSASAPLASARCRRCAWRRRTATWVTTSTPLTPRSRPGWALRWPGTSHGGFVGREALLKQQARLARPSRGWSTSCWSRPTTTWSAPSPIYWDGEPVGVMRVGAFGYTLGRPAASPMSSAKTASPRPTSRPARSRSTSRARGCRPRSR